MFVARPLVGGQGRETAFPCGKLECEVGLALESIAYARQLLHRRNLNASMRFASSTVREFCGLFGSYAEVDASTRQPLRRTHPTTADVLVRRCQLPGLVDRYGPLADSLFGGA